MKKEGLPDFGFDYFSPTGQAFQDRKNRIKTICFKVCSKCGEIKPIFKFSVEKRNLNGRTGICKACKIMEYLKYYYQNREKILIKCKKYRDNDKGRRSMYYKKYQKDHKKQLKKKAGEWYKKNRKAIKKRNLQYYQENKEACQTRRELWREKNKEKIKEYNREYNLNRRIGNKKVVIGKNVCGIRTERSEKGQERIEGRTPG